MGLKEYNVVVGNTATTMQLSDEDAERYGVGEKDLVKAVKAAPKPANKSRSGKRAPANKAAAAPSAAPTAPAGEPATPAADAATK